MRNNFENFLKAPIENNGGFLQTIASSSSMSLCSSGLSEKQQLETGEDATTKTDDDADRLVIYRILFFPYIVFRSHFFDFSSLSLSRRKENHRFLLDFFKPMCRENQIFCLLHSSLLCCDSPSLSPSLIINILSLLSSIQAEGVCFYLHISLSGKPKPKNESSIIQSYYVRLQASLQHLANSNWHFFANLPRCS